MRGLVGLIFAFGCTHKPVAPPAPAVAAPDLFAGCQAWSKDHLAVTLTCPDRQICQVSPGRQLPEAALAAFVQAAPNAGARADDAEGPLVLLPGADAAIPEGAVTVRTLEPWVSQVIACTATVSTAAASSPRFQWMRAHGLPPLQPLMADWAPPSWQGKDLTVPDGCLTSGGEGGFRISCGVDHLVVVKKAGVGAEAFVRGGIVETQLLAKTRGLDMESQPRSCTLDGRPATCRLDINHAPQPSEPPYQLLAAYDDSDGLVIARCAWGSGVELPGFCGQVMAIVP